MIDDERFLDDLRASLDSEAGRAPHVDLGESALKQARRIRLRRRAGAGLVAVAVLAAVPFGIDAFEADPKDNTAQPPALTEPVEVKIEGLSQGPAPTVAYIDADTYTTASGTAYPVRRDGGDVTDAAVIGGQVAQWNLNPRTGKTTVSMPASVPTIPDHDSATAPAVDRSGEQVSWAISSRAGDDERHDLIFAEMETGALESLPVEVDIQSVMALKDGAVVFNAKGEQSTYVGRIDVQDALGDEGQVETPWREASYVTAVDGDLQQMVGHPADLVGRDRNCSVMYDLDEQAETWTTCEWRPVEFSPDGSRVLALPVPSDGLGPRELAVLDSSDGSVRQVYITEGTFGRATFEGEESMISVVVVGDQSALVRCSIEDPTCELATPPEQVPPGDPDALVYPYQLTAN